MANLKSLLTASSGLTGAGLQQIGITGASLGITATSLNIPLAEDRLFKEVTDGSRAPYQIPTITTVNARQNVWQYNWSTSDPWTGYYNYLTGAGIQVDGERAFWFSLGVGTRQNTLSYSSTDSRSGAYIDYAKNSVAGGESMFATTTNNTANGPMRFRTIFLRNHHPSIAKTVTMYGHYSNWYSSGHEGSGVCIGTPNVNGSYANVTDVTYTLGNQRTGGNSAYTWNWTVTIPAKTTVSVTQTNSMYYWQSSGGYKWFDINKFYDLHTTFTDRFVQPDLKMTQAAISYNDFDNQFNTRTARKIWNRTAEMFGDR
jgi:hypothetical protein